MIPSVRGSVETGNGSFSFPMRISGDPDRLKVFAERMRTLDGYQAFRVVPEAETTVCIYARGEIPQGGYVLSVSPGKIVVESSDSEGTANALTTLYVRIREGNGVLQYGRTEDAPRFEHRGFLMDCSRHFFPVETVKKMIEQASLRKMNRLHWHISDDQGYRLESRRFPELNTVSSWRDDPVLGPRYGGYYTFEEVRDIVAYAKDRGMEIIPEIDMPGHVTAILTAHPELSCSGQAADLGGMQYGIFDRILCAGKDETLSFMEELLDEVCGLFPYPMIHIGGDEAPKTEWQKCPHCRKRIRDLGLKDEEALQAWFTNRISDHLLSRGKRPVCWNEALKSEDLDESVVIQYWDEESHSEDPSFYCRDRLGKGYRWIYSFAPDFYFDYSPCLCPMRKTAGVTDRLRSGERIPEDKLLGYECTLWSEQILTEDRLTQLAFPRMFAVAELGWSGMADYGRFLEECAKETEVLGKAGIACFSVEEADPAGEKQKQAVLAEWGPRVAMMGQIPGAEKFKGVIAGLIRGKLEDCMDEEDVDGLLSELHLK